MGRNPSGVYSLPAGSLVSDGATSAASQHNTPLQDLETDMNAARPVVAGGTGATTAADARTNLGLGTMATQADSAVDINGGAIDGTPIGASSASTGAFTTLSVSGLATLSDGVTVSNDSASVATLNRTTNDGDIEVFQKDGTTVGSIGTNSGQPYFINSSNAGVRLYTNGVAAAGSGGAFADNLQDLGSSSVRWDDIYATNGTIQTSDRNEKQDIRPLAAAEVAAAQELATQGVIYRWISAVEEKGAAARQHSGHIAQDVKATLEKHGLNAFDYAFLSYSEWVDEKTGESRSRYGLRYTELHSFIMAGSAQFVQDLAARVAALETP